MPWHESRRPIVVALALLAAVLLLVMLRADPPAVPAAASPLQRVALLSDPARLPPDGALDAGARPAGNDCPPANSHAFVTHAALPPALRDELAATLLSLQTELSRGTERQQALAWLLSAEFTRQAALQERTAADAAQLAAMLRAADLRAAPSRAALLRLAQTSRDPAAYRLAYLYCQPARARGDLACQSLTAAEWARRDPADGSAWLRAADEAERLGDLAARDDALLRAARSSRLSDGWSEDLFPLLTHAQIEAASPKVQAAWWSTTQLLTGDLPPPHQAVAATCLRASQPEPARRALCRELASVMLNHDPSVMGRQLGLGLARRVDWPADDYARRRDETRAMQWLQRDAAFNPAGADGCARVDALRRQLAARGARGEVAELQRQLADSGVPASDLAARWREDIRRMYGRLPDGE